MTHRADKLGTVVIGSHSGTLADRLFVGNVAEKIFRRSPVPVTTIQRPERIDVAVLVGGWIAFGE